MLFWSVALEREIVTFLEVAEVNIALTYTRVSTCICSVECGKGSLTY